MALHSQDITLIGSHLCSRANSFNPYYIYDESQNDNNNRQRCLGYIACGNYNHMLAKLCQHNLPYIKPPIGSTILVNLSWELVIADATYESSMRTCRQFLDNSHPVPAIGATAAVVDRTQRRGCGWRRHRSDGSQLSLQ